MTDEIENQGTNDVATGEEKPKRASLILTVIFVGLVLVIGVGLYADAQPRSIPQPFIGQITSLQHDRAELAKKRQDLEKQISELDAQDRWDCERENAIGGEALQSLKLSNREYLVDVDKMLITARK